VVEHRHHASVTTFVVEGPVVVGEMPLDETASHHAEVKRLSVGDPVAITDGRGNRGVGRIAGRPRKQVVVTVNAIASIPAPPPIHLFLPVADRDRMLWLAEKATELQVASWNPVIFRRSMSVSPRGEGEAFDRKLRARMVAAVEQSGGAWLPTIAQVIEPPVLRLPAGSRGFIFERGGVAFGRGVQPSPPVSLIVGPEGGFEEQELALLQQKGWVVASLGDVTLRFETAAVAGIAIARGQA
jgi:16S rRNA (uracil1498-N3)-methyltransferase